MALNKRIKIARGAHSAIANSTEIPADGELVYDKTNNTLIVGDGTTQLKSRPELDARKAEKDLSGNVITSTYGASIEIGEDSKLHLLNKEGNSLGDGIVVNPKYGITTKTDTGAVSVTLAPDTYIKYTNRISSISNLTISSPDTTNLYEYVLEFQPSSSSFTINGSSTTVLSGYSFVNGWALSDIRNNIGNTWIMYFLGNSQGGIINLLWK